MSRSPSPSARPGNTFCVTTTPIVRSLTLSGTPNQSIEGAPINSARRQRRAVRHLGCGEQGLSGAQTYSVIPCAACARMSRAVSYSIHEIGESSRSFSDCRARVEVLAGMSSPTIS